jgi:hypothetical protein
MIQTGRGRSSFTGPLTCPWGWSGNVSNSNVTTYAPDSWVQANNVRAGGIAVPFSPMDGKTRRHFQNFMDVRLEKSFKVFIGNLGFFIDAFNIFGYKWAQMGDTPAGIWRPTGDGTREGTYTTDTGYGKIWRLFGTREFRLSIRYTF